MNWQTLSQSSLCSILNWAESQAWSQAMRECAQDKEWHAEGDVWTHTRMVCDELTKLDEWPSLAQQDQTKLIMVALFHDSAKPHTTQIDPETGRVSSPKHSIKGEHLVRNELRALGCELHTREEIAKLVRFHGRPAFSLERERPENDVIRLSWVLSNRLLYLFTLADTRGRKTQSMSRPEETLHLWKMMAEENGCFESPYPFANDQARLNYFAQANPDIHYIPHEDFACEVTMMSGLPGSGKDTWLAKNAASFPVVSLDALRRELNVRPTDDQGKVVQLARERCREHLRLGTSFGFNATNLLKQTRKKWLDLFMDYQARVRLIYVEPPFSTILRQNRDRPVAVPESVIRSLAAKCDPPTLDEAHERQLVDGE